VHLATATGTPDSSGSNLRLAHICRMKRLCEKYLVMAEEDTSPFS